jgi:hypothetical protein
MADNLPDANQHKPGDNQSPGIRPPATPPRWAEKLLEQFCPPRDREEVQGDLLELYRYWAQRDGEKPPGVVTRSTR